MTDATTTPHVYTAWAGVCEDMARGGIGKNREASMGSGGRYNFRGIDDVLIALSASMVAHKLGIGIVFGDPVVSIRDKGNGRSERHIVCSGAFTLVSQIDGSREGPFRFIGEAADSGDKATNKAMSIAYKYFAIQTFAIPTEGVLDDETPNEVEPAKPVQYKQGARMIAGPHKGTLFSEATTDQLNAYGLFCESVLRDPAKAAHHGKAEAETRAIMEEFDARDMRL